MNHFILSYEKAKAFFESFSTTYSDHRVVTSVLVILAAIIISRIIHYIISVKLKQYVKKTKTRHDDNLVNALDGPVAIFIYLWATYLCVQLIGPADHIALLNKGVYVLITINITWLLFRLTDVATEFVSCHYEQKDKKLANSLFPFLNKSLKIFLLIISFILIIQNLGYSVSSLIAGLGIGGAAIALASKDTIANVFGSMMIFIDKPFEIGDWIVVSDTEGIVEDVGFRTTRIRTFARNEVSIPNNIVANTTIQNFSRRPMQRISTTIGVTYDTTPDQMEEAVKRIREIILDHPDTDKNTAFVYFSEYADSSLKIFLYFFINSSNWEVFLKARHEIFLSFMKCLKDLNMSFAFPSTTVYLEETPFDTGRTQVKK